MIAYITGKLASLYPTYVVIEASGVGYHIHISLNTYAKISHLLSETDNIRLFTHLHIKEDAHTLYGFADEGEKRLFSHLISVSGIGPSTGRMMLSSVSTEELEQAIIQGDIATIKRVKGIGPKSAQRLILELQDKLKKDGHESLVNLPTNQSAKEEALSALMMLGFNRMPADKAIETVLQSDRQATVEVLIKKALKLL